MPTRVSNVTDAIEQLGSWDPSSATDLDGTIRNLSGIADAAGGSLHQIARTLEGTGTHDDFATMLHEAAAAVHHHSQELQGHLSGGLTSHAGGSPGGHAPHVRGVIDTVHELGGWDPGDDPEELHGTISALAGVLQAVRTSYGSIGQTVAGTGAHASYPGHLQHAAGGIGAIADGLGDAFADGVLRRPR
jgi:hypothetical protein